MWLCHSDKFIAWIAVNVTVSFYALIFLRKKVFIMDIIYPICCGLDVHKKSVVASIAVTNPVTLEATYSVKSFSTMNSDIYNLHDWL